MPSVSHPNNKNPKKQEYFSSSWLYLHTSLLFAIFSIEPVHHNQVAQADCLKTCAKCAVK